MSAEMRPLLTRALAPPAQMGLADVALLAHDDVRAQRGRAGAFEGHPRAGVVKVEVPVPPMLFAAPSVLSRLTMPLLAIFTLPLTSAVADALAGIGVGGVKQAR